MHSATINLVQNHNCLLQNRSKINTIIKEYFLNNKANKMIYMPKTNKRFLLLFMQKACKRDIKEIEEKNIKFHTVFLYYR